MCIRKVWQWLFGIDCKLYDSTSLIGQKSSTEVAYSEVHQQLRKTKRRVKSLVHVVQAQNRLLSSLARKHDPAFEIDISDDNWLLQGQVKPDPPNEWEEEGEEGIAQKKITAF